MRTPSKRPRRQISMPYRFHGRQCMANGAWRSPGPRSTSNMYATHFSPRGPGFSKPHRVPGSYCRARSARMFGDEIGQQSVFGFALLGPTCVKLTSDRGSAGVSCSTGRMMRPAVQPFARTAAPDRCPSFQEKGSAAPCDCFALTAPGKTNMRLRAVLDRGLSPCR